MQAILARLPRRRIHAARGVLAALAERLQE
jgi:hypothetical protein